MAGPVTLALGPFLFQAHGFGYDAITRRLETPWAEVPRMGEMSALQWMGPDSEEISIAGVLFPEAFGGMTTLEGLRLAARRGVPLMMVSLGGRIFGRHAIQGIDEERSHHGRSGLPGRISYTLTLRRLPRATLIEGLAGQVAQALPGGGLS